MTKKYFLYRFVQIVFVVGILLSITFAMAVYTSLSPKSSIDMKLSKILCSNGKSYSFVEADIYSYVSGNTTQILWLSGDNRKAVSICSTGIPTESRDTLLTAEEWSSKIVTFSKHEKTVTVGTYKEAIGGAILTFIVSIVALYILKEAALYLFYAKRFFHALKMD